MKNLQAKLRTKSNYRNLNETWQDVSELAGTRVSCRIKDAFDRVETIDFTLKEVVEFREVQTTINLSKLKKYEKVMQ